MLAELDQKRTRLAELVALFAAADEEDGVAVDLFDARMDRSDLQRRSAG